MNETAPAPENPILANLVEDGHATAMQQRMQQDVTAWSASRADAPTPALVSRPAPARAAAAGAVKRAAPPKAAPVASSPATAPAPRKPFAMKYDGQSASRHAAERFARGAR